MEARHTLVVGGSGMLAGLCRSLSAEGRQVTVVGRDQGKLARVARGDLRVHPLSVDYEEIGTLAAALEGAVGTRGPIALAVCWIRSWAPQSLLTAADAVAPGGRLFHVLGSQGSHGAAAATAELRQRNGLQYRAVHLGAVAGAESRRWLTDDEISAGVYSAVLADQPSYLVGTVAP